MSSQADKDAKENKPVRLRILDKEVQIACKPGEENDLAKAAAHIDKSMRSRQLILPMLCYSFSLKQTRPSVMTSANNWPK